MSGAVCGRIAWNERVSAAARGQQSAAAAAATSRASRHWQALAGRLFGCEEAGTMRRDETLSPAKEGRSPGRPGNNNGKKQTVSCSALDIAKNTLISSSWSSNDWSYAHSLDPCPFTISFLLPSSSPPQRTVSTLSRRVAFNKPSKARPAKLRLLISLRLADHPIERARLNSI